MEHESAQDDDHPPALEVCARTDTREVSLQHLHDDLERGLHVIGCRQAKLSVVVVDDPAMATLHATYLDDPTPTDVLTFDLRDPGSQPILPDGPPPTAAPLDGEIIVSLDTARRQAAQRGHETQAELLLYVIHGVLHLMGHGDKDPASAQAMHRREDEILTALGYGSVYAGADR